MQLLPTEHLESLLKPYVDGLTSLDEEAKQAYLHPDFFAEYVMLDPRGERFVNKPFHQVMYEKFWEKRPLVTQTKQTCLILAPRGHGKSTVAIAWTAWCLGRNRDLRILFVSAVEELAKERMRQVESVLSDRRYLSIFGDLRPRKAEGLLWNDTFKVVSGRSPHAKGYSLMAAGAGSNILGNRADIVIADDLVSLENSSTLHQRQQLRRWFWEVLWPICEPGGQLIALGTRFFYDDLYAELKRKWDTKDGVITFAAEDEHGDPIWPERFSKEALMDERRSMGSTFYLAQYLNNPVPPDGDLLRREWLHLEVVVPEEDQLVYYAGMDPCIKANTPDYACIAILGKKPEDTKSYLVELIRFQGGFFEQLHKLRDLHQQYNFQNIVIESNQGQDFMKQFADQELQELPLRTSHSRVPKEIRFLLNMARFFEFGQVVVPAYVGDTGLEPLPNIQQFVHEWCAFPSKEFPDDTLSAVEKAVEAAQLGSNLPATGALDPPERPHWHDHRMVNPLRSRDPLALFRKNRRIGW